MTIYTPVYGLARLADGQPLRDTALVLQEATDTIEAALLRGAIAPPLPADYSSLVSRVGALETAPSRTAPVTMTKDATKFQNFGSTTALRYWSEGKTAFLAGHVQVLTGVTLTTSSETTIATLPAGFRPAESQFHQCYINAKTPVRFDVESTGEVQIVNDTGASITAGTWFTVRTFWALP